MKTIFDVGMYDAQDTIYYLEQGFRVVAVEANPNLVQRAKERLSSYVESGQLHLVNSAIGLKGDTIELVVCGDDLGSSTVHRERVANRNPIGSYSVPAISIQELFEIYRVPYYLKVDIEGADRLCVLALTCMTRPQFLSFEIGDDVEELVMYAQEIGYKRFKIINQTNFFELANERRIYDRVAHRIMKYMGYTNHERVRRDGRFFNVGHSSGPVPWRSDGNWYSGQKVLLRWREAKKSNMLSGWYDMHVA
jgi:FkbM family methyltransferase